MAAIHEAVAAVVAALSPFMPFLVDTAKASGTKLAEAMAEHGGAAAWKRAVAVWGALRTEVGDPADIKGAALMLSADVDSEEYRRTFATVLSRHLESRPEAAERLAGALRGEPSLQTVVARSRSQVNGVEQLAAGDGGIQRVEAIDGSAVTRVRQSRFGGPQP